MVSGLAAFMLPYRTDRNADAAEAHVLIDSFQSQPVGGFLALAGVVELVAVDVYIPQLTVGSLCRAGCHTLIAFAALAFVNWRIQWF